MPLVPFEAGGQPVKAGQLFTFGPLPPKTLWVMTGGEPPELPDPDEPLEPLPVDEPEFPVPDEPFETGPGHEPAPPPEFGMGTGTGGGGAGCDVEVAAALGVAVSCGGVGGGFTDIVVGAV